MLIFILLIITLLISSYAVHAWHTTQRAEQIRAQRKAAIHTHPHQKHPEG